MFSFVRDTTVIICWHFSFMTALSMNKNVLLLRDVVISINLMRLFIVCPVQKLCGDLGWSFECTQLKSCGNLGPVQTTIPSNNASKNLKGFTICFTQLVVQTIEPCTYYIKCSGPTKL